MDFHCPTEVLADGTIIFPVRVGEQNFFQYGLEFIESFQLQVLIRQICCPYLLQKIKLTRAGDQTCDLLVQGQMLPTEL